MTPKWYCVPSSMVKVMMKPFLAGSYSPVAEDDLHVGVAVLEVEAADQIAVGLDAVGVVNVGGLQKAEKVRLRGLDDVSQAVIRIGMVAGEDDGFDAGLFALVDFEDQSTRVFGRWMIFGTTWTSKRPLRW